MEFMDRENSYKKPDKKARNRRSGDFWLLNNKFTLLSQDTIIEPN